jgi:hypothetical protein
MSDDGSIQFAGVTLRHPAPDEILAWVGRLGDVHLSVRYEQKEQGREFWYRARATVSGLSIDAFGHTLEYCESGLKREVANTLSRMEALNEDLRKASALLIIGGERHRDTVGDR